MHITTARSVNIVLVGVVLVLLGIVGYLGFRTWTQDNYVGVYTTTGDLYFGSVRPFSRTTLTDAYILQQTNNTETPFALQRLADVFWAPRGTLRLNDSQIVWMARLRPESQVVQYIRGTSQLPQPEQSTEE